MSEVLQRETYLPDFGKEFGLLKNLVMHLGPCHGSMQWRIILPGPLVSQMESTIV